ncbi:hypothetical protein SNEBB_003496 [Seison nebaliae]|nr:hypothetical protein SNEBB_003496 [Seison nebaliae]
MNEMRRLNWLENDLKQLRPLEFGKNNILPPQVQLSSNEEENSKISKITFPSSDESRLLNEVSDEKLTDEKKRKKSRKLFSKVRESFRRKSNYSCQMDHFHLVSTEEESSIKQMNLGKISNLKNLVQSTTTSSPTSTPSPSDSTTKNFKNSKSKITSLTNSKEHHEMTRTDKSKLMETYDEKLQYRYNKFLRNHPLMAKYNKSCELFFSHRCHRLSSNLIWDGTLHITEQFIYFHTRIRKNRVVFIWHDIVNIKKEKIFFLPTGILFELENNRRFMFSFVRDRNLIYEELLAIKKTFGSDGTVIQKKRERRKKQIERWIQRNENFVKTRINNHRRHSSYMTSTPRKTTEYGRSYSLVNLGDGEIEEVEEEEDNGDVVASNQKKFKGKISKLELKKYENDYPPIPKLPVSNPTTFLRRRINYNRTDIYDTDYEDLNYSNDEDDGDSCCYHRLSFFNLPSLIILFFRYMFNILLFIRSATSSSSSSSLTTGSNIMPSSFSSSSSSTLREKQKEKKNIGRFLKLSNFCSTKCYIGVLVFLFISLCYHTYRLFSIIERLQSKLSYLQQFNI